ncbi:MAG: hypothetical protein AAGA54_06950 [Myxococcota bacterium]
MSLLFGCTLVACDADGNSVGATATTTGAGSGSTSGGGSGSDEAGSEDTGEDPAGTGVEPGGSTGFFPPEGQCDQIPTVIGLEDDNVTDRTAQQVLDVALGEYTGAMRWVDEGPVLYQGALGPTPTTLELTYAGGDVRSVEGVLVEACGHDGPCPCPSVLEIDAGLRITTEDGAIDDTFEVVLTYSQGDDSGFDPAGISINQVFDPDASGGTLAGSDFAVSETFEVLEFSFGFGLDEAGALGGSIGAEVEGMGFGGFGPVAQFGAVSTAEACVAFEGGSSCQLAGCTEVSGRPVFGSAPDMCECNPGQLYCFPDELVGDDAVTLYTRLVGPASDPYQEVVEFGVSTELGGDWRACADAPDVELCGCEGSCN